MDRRNAILLSLSATVILNFFAGILTILYANGTTIVEANPLSHSLLQTFGPGALLLHAILIALLYPLAYVISKMISSTHWLFRSKRILLFTFSLLVAVLPIGALVDLTNDVLVVSMGSDILVGTQKIVAFAFVFAIAFAVIQVRRGWTLGQTARLNQRLGWRNKDTMRTIDDLVSAGMADGDYVRIGPEATSKAGSPKAEVTS